MQLHARCDHDLNQAPLRLLAKTLHAGDLVVGWPSYEQDIHALMSKAAPRAPKSKQSSSWARH
eukprot:5694157-Amphidinium_carterae.1